MTENIYIAIDGVIGAGKSTLINHLIDSPTLSFVCDIIKIEVFHLFLI